MLVNQGYKIKAYVDPKEAFEYIKENHSILSAIITDYIMPTMTGVELIK